MMQVDAVELEVFRNLFHSIAEEMGAALRRTAFSPNIKERRDYSCAVFDAHGEVIAMGDNMPVHLGSMPMSVRVALDQLTLERGDVAMLNDPFAGGTHLPDITLVAPVWFGASGKRTADFYVASRAHHADVGGMHPGSMGLCESIYQEGLRIPPVKIVRQGAMSADVLRLLLANVRTPEERRGDLEAQLAACHTGAERLRDSCRRYGLKRVQAAGAALHDYAERMIRSVLLRVPAGRYEAEDALDDDGYSDDAVKIKVAITFAKSPLVTVDFTGTAKQVRGSINAVEAIAYSACFFVFRCLLAEEVPASAGIMRGVKVIAPCGSVVSAELPAAVAGGNVECSQRIVDVLLRALAQALPERIPAASYGTMSNVTIGGLDARTGMSFAYYETIAGGMGARPTKAGVSGIHMHMTNSLNTPAEALEYAYPLRVTRYSLRRGSGGEGRFRGGDGIVRELELLADAEVTLLADRHRTQPYGLSGGGPGASGAATAVYADGREERMKSKGSRLLLKGTRVRMETPGGGGWGV
ncbi:MAG: hydantoinase B/oxoprolinase family protein [Acidobacteriaceae bacterium]